MTRESAPLDRERVRSILVIRFRYLGDMVVLSPLFRNLRHHFPDAHLAALADEAYTEILGHQPDLNEVIGLPRERTDEGAPWSRAREWMRVFRDVRARKFDLVVDVNNTRTSHLLVRASRAPHRLGYEPFDQQKSRQNYNLWAKRFSGEDHFLDHYLEPIRALGLSVISRQPCLVPRAEDEEAIDRLLREHDVNEFVAIHPGARVGRRCWPPAHFARLIDQLENELHLRAVLVGGKPERARRDEILRMTQSSPIDLVERLSIGQLLALSQRCRAFVGNDSGPMHIASAAGARVVALFGPGDPKYWAPVGDGHQIIATECACGLNMKQHTPCDDTGPQCLQRISVEQVLAAVRACAGEPALAGSAR